MSGGWTAVALSRDVPAGATRAIVLDGAERVAWRGGDGAIHLWEDRCPHRGMRLSFGFVRGETLNCLYHGWQYGVGSQCIRIPAHPDLAVPPSIRAKAFPVREAGGLIWTRADDDEAAAPLAPTGLTPLASVAARAGDAALEAKLGTGPLTRIEGTGLHVAWHRADMSKAMLHALAEPGTDTLSALRALRGLRAGLEARQAA